MLIATYSVILERHAPCILSIPYARFNSLERRMNMMTAAFLMNGALYVCLIGILAMAWGWLQRSGS